MIDRLSEENVKLRAEKSHITSKYKRLKNTLQNRFREKELGNGGLSGSMSPGLAITGQRLVASDDELELTPSPDFATPATPGSPVFPNLVQLGQQDVPAQEPPKPSKNSLEMLMKSSNSPMKSPVRRRPTPRKRVQNSPKSDRLKQLKLDVFSPRKPETETDNHSPFKIPRSPSSRSIYEKFDTVVTPQDDLSNSSDISGISPLESEKLIPKTEPQSPPDVEKNNSSTSTT